ncbi:hypothetical protein B7486_56675, partial [cyanobacterium TDX16]
MSVVADLDVAPVAVVIPTCDRPLLLARCLEAVRAQTWSTPFEVVVVDDGRIDVTSVVGAVPGARAISSGRRGPAAARNLGWQAVQAGWIAFTDDDAQPEPGWLEALMAARAEGVVGVAGAVTAPAGWDPLYEHAVEADAVGHFLTCNVAYARAALVQVGGFNEVFPHAAGEDWDLGERASRLGRV